MKKEQTLWIIRGCPGSGKTTFSKKLQEMGEISCFCEADFFMTDAKGNYQYNTEYLSACHELCFGNARSYLRAGLSVAVSNTFTHLWETERYLELAKSLDVEVKVVKMNNRFKSVHHVPASIIDRMISDYEPIESERVVLTKERV